MKYSQKNDFENVIIRRVKHNEIYFAIRSVQC